MLTTDPTERGLLDAIIAKPDDDAPHLILADFYEENGHEERGRFIRLQCAEPDKDNAYCGIDGNYSMAHDKWADACGHLIDKVPRHANAIFRRGFVCQIHCRHEAWEQYGDAVLSEWPITLVRLTSLPEVRVNRTGARFGISLYEIGILGNTGFIQKTEPNDCLDAWESQWASRYPHLKFERPKYNLDEGRHLMMPVNPDAVIRYNQVGSSQIFGVSNLIDDD